MFNYLNLLLIILLFSFSKYSFSDTFAEEDLIRIQKYLEELNSFEAEFLQISPQGEVKKGKLYLDLPGKLRINYTQPSDLLITSNGFWLVIQNLKLKQTNNIPINQSPLNTFLNKKIVLNKRDVRIKLRKLSGVISLTYSDKENMQSPFFRLEFSDNPIKLKKWIIKDEFENKTTVLLQNLTIGQKYSNQLFIPEDFGDQN